MTQKKTDEGYPIFRSYLEEENDKPYYSMNTLSFYYEDMERKQKLIEDLAKAIAGYDQTLTGNLQAIEQQVAERFDQWDEKLKTFDGSVMDLLQEWVDDGTMDHIVDSSIVDRKLEPIAAQLAEKAQQSALDVERAKINNLIANAGNTDGNAELLDLRVGFDGGTYPTAGEATRAIGDYIDFHMGKVDNLFDGDYENCNLGGNASSATLRNTNVGGRSAIIPVSPNETYEIFKGASDRFRIALHGSYPEIPEGQTYVNIQRFVKDTEYEGEKTYTITTLPGENFLIITVSLVEAEPTMQVIKTSKKSPEDFGAVGNANYMDETGGLWQDSSYTIAATDDTEAIKSFLKSGGFVEFPKKKNYLITSSITISPESVRKITGNGSTLVGNGDFVILDVTGNAVDGSANPLVSGGLVYKEHGLVIDNLKITSKDKVSCTGIRLRSTFGVTIVNSSLFFLKNGISIEGKNRNIIFNSNHVYACLDYGIYFVKSGDLHQGVFVGNHISYCTKCVYANDQNLYNLQFLGNDIETSSYPATPIHTIHFYADTALVEDIKFVGNTIECHAKVSELVRIEGVNGYKILTFSFTGNVIGNSYREEMLLGGIEGLVISGNIFKKSLSYSVKVIGNIKGATITGNVFHKNRGGLLTSADSDLTGFTFSNNDTTGRVSESAIDLTGGNLKQVSITDNNFTLTDVIRYISGKAIVNINALTVTNCKILNNTISNETDITKAVSVISGSISLLICKNNIAQGFSNNPYEFPQTSGHIVVSDNIFS